MSEETSWSLLQTRGQQGPTDDEDATEAAIGGGSNVDKLIGFAVCANLRDESDQRAKAKGLSRPGVYLKF